VFLNKGNYGFAEILGDVFGLVFLHSAEAALTFLFLH